MKRLRKLSLTLTAVILALATLLAGCTGSGNNSSSAAANSSAASGTASSSDEKPIGVALIVNGTIGDKSFNDLAYAGMLQAEKEFNIKGKLVENNYDTTKYEPSIIEFAEDPNYDLIICNSADVKEIIEKVAPDYPDKRFVLYDSDIDYSTGDLSNVYSMTFKQNEASFLAGAMAARLTSSGADRTNEDKLIGFIAGGENVIINDFLLGYILGCEYGDPDVKMFISYIGDFKNTAKGKEMALAQIMQNADIIFQVAGGGGLGILEAAKEKNIYAIGVDDDQYLLFKETDEAQANAIVSSVVKNVDDCIYTVIKRDVEGTLPYGETESLGLKEGLVAIAQNDYYKSVVPEDIQQFISETEAKIISGEIVVETNIGQPTETINNARNSIKP